VLKGVQIGFPIASDNPGRSDFENPIRVLAAQRVSYGWADPRVEGIGRVEGSENLEAVGGVSLKL